MYPEYDQLNSEKGTKNAQWKKNCLFKKWCWKNLQDNEIGPLPYTIHKNQLKTDSRLNCKAKTYKMSGRKRRGKLHDTDFDIDFLDIISKSMGNKSKTK